MPPAFVRLAGHGLRLLPAPPFAISAQHQALEVVYERAELETTAVVDRSHSLGVLPYGELLEATDELACQELWTVEVGGVYLADWPTGLALRSWPQPDQPPFFMLSDGAGSLVYVQGPFSLAAAPSIEAMRRPGQRERRRKREGDLEWVDLRYEHNGEPWHQRHIRKVVAPIGVLVVTVQASQLAAARITGQGMALAASLRADSR